MTTHSRPILQTAAAHTWQRALNGLTERLRRRAAACVVKIDAARVVVDVGRPEWIGWRRLLSATSTDLHRQLATAADAEDLAEMIQRRTMICRTCEHGRQSGHACELLSCGCLRKRQRDIKANCPIQRWKK
jgi:hypothetical protein